MGKVAEGRQNSEKDNASFVPDGTSSHFEHKPQRWAIFFRPLGCGNCKDNGRHRGGANLR